MQSLDTFNTGMQKKQNMGGHFQGGTYIPECDKFSSTSSDLYGEKAALEQKTNQGQGISAKTTNEKESVFWKIYEGSMTVDVPSESRKRKMRQTQLFSAFGYNFIRLFTEIPRRLHLSTKLTKTSFHHYIDKVLSPQRRRGYLVLPAFIRCDDFMAVKVMLKRTQRVASMEYSKKCKVFIFPREMLKGEWLNILNFVVVKNQNIQSFDLLCFLVAKLSVTQYETCIDPEPVPFTRGAKAITIQKNEFEQESSLYSNTNNSSRLNKAETLSRDLLDAVGGGNFNWDDGMSIFDGASSKGGALSHIIDGEDNNPDFEDFESFDEDITANSIPKINKNKSEGRFKSQKNHNSTDLENKEAFGTSVYNNFDEDAFNGEFGGFTGNGIDENGLFTGFQNFPGQDMMPTDDFSPQKNLPQVPGAGLDQNIAFQDGDSELFNGPNFNDSPLKDKTNVSHPFFNFT